MQRKGERRRKSNGGNRVRRFAARFRRIRGMCASNATNLFRIDCRFDGPKRFAVVGTRNRTRQETDGSLLRNSNDLLVVVQSLDLPMPASKVPVGNEGVAGRPGEVGRGNSCVERRIEGAEVLKHQLVFLYSIQWRSVPTKVNGEAKSPLGMKYTTRRRWIVLVNGPA